jgi:hypothetical protein
MMAKKLFDEGCYTECRGRGERLRDLGKATIQVDADTGTA